MTLKKGQVIFVEGERYFVTSKISFREETWRWDEYEITSITNRTKWLSVEEIENGKLEYCLYDDVYENIDLSSLEIKYNNEIYRLTSKGEQVVTSYFGNTDVDSGEVAKYQEYMSEDEEKTISVEDWDGELEKSFGRYIDETQIKITEEIEKPKRSKMSKKAKSEFMEKFYTVLCIMIVFLPSFFSAFAGSGLFAKRSMLKYLDKNKVNYKYVTSVTSNVGKEKAKVYESRLFTVDATVKDIIDEVPEAVKKVTDNSLNSIGISTKNEYAYVYRELGKVYVQVSNVKYLRNSGHMYHRNHYYHYRNGYYGNNKSYLYTNYANSARQESINARRSSGGGTSSGK